MARDTEIQERERERDRETDREERERGEREGGKQTNKQTTWLQPAPNKQHAFNLLRGDPSRPHAATSREAYRCVDDVVDAWPGARDRLVRWQSDAGDQERGANRGAGHLADHKRTHGCCHRVRTGQGRDDEEHSGQSLLADCVRAHVCDTSEHPCPRASILSPRLCHVHCACPGRGAAKASGDRRGVPVAVQRRGVLVLAGV